jgi:flavin reductase (DIM6/NTAB) family NADH-FMN oxidoreductase RutF
MRTFDPDELDRPRLTALANGKRPVVVPRRAEAGDAIDDHQLEFARRVASRGLVTLVEDLDDLSAALHGRTEAVGRIAPDRRLISKLSSLQVDPSVDEWEITGLLKRPSTTVRPPSVAESPAAFECRMFTIVDLGPADKPTNSLVIARVVRIHVSEGVIDPETLRVDAEALGLVGRMGGDLYCTTRDRFSLPRPSLDEGRAGKPIAPEPDPQSVA